MKQIKKNILQVYRIINKNLKSGESLQVKNPDAPLSHSVIFILGAPRSGTTLLYQSLITAFDFSFFSNIHCSLFGAPWLIERLINPNQKYHSSSFSSKLGKVKGWNAPSECGPFWYRFFPKNPQYATADTVESDKMKQLRTSLHAFLNASQKPILFKNVINTLRLEPLMKILPEALFIVIRRDLTDTAHSILKARKEQSGSYEEWFSLRPPNIKKLKKYPPHIQAVEQVKTAYSLIDTAEQKSPDKFFNIRYENFCADPELSLQKLYDFLESNNVTVEAKNKLPDSFPMSSQIAIDNTLYNNLLAYIKNQQSNE